MIAILNKVLDLTIRDIIYNKLTFFFAIDLSY